MRYRKLSIIAILLTLSMSTTQVISASDGIWPMYKGSAQHTGQSAFNGSEENTLRWIFPTGGRITSSPIIGADGTICVGSYDSNLYAINPDGSLKWKFKADQIIDSTPAIGADGTIYFGSWDENMYAIRPDGSGIWRVQTHGRISSSPTIGPDGTIYIGSDDGFLYAITPKGSLRWSFNATERVFSTPALGHDGTVYIGSFDNRTYALNPDGSVKWRFRTGAYVFSTPSVGPDGTVYVGSYDGFVYAINPNGSLKWRFLANGVVQTSPSIGKDGTIYAGSFDGNLYAIYQNGTKKWSFKTGDLVVSSPVIDSDGTLYFGSVDNNTYAVNPDGTEKWRFATGARIFSSPAIGPDGTVYIGSVDNGLYAIGKPLPGAIPFPVRGLVKESVGYRGVQIYVVDVNETGAQKTVTATVILKNYGNEPRILDPESFTLKDMDGHEYKVDMRSTLKRVKIEARDIVRGMLHFEVSGESAPYMLQYRDPWGVRLDVDLTATKSDPDAEPSSIFRTGSNVGKKLIGGKIEMTVIDEAFLKTNPLQYAVTVAIKNLSSEPLMYNQSYAYVKDAMGNVYTANTDKQFSGELAAGQTATGQIVFTVSNNVDSVILVYDDITTDTYFVVPEFPLSAIMMAISLSLVLFAYRVSKAKLYKKLVLAVKLSHYLRLVSPQF